ncbi:hypothetical protein B0H13DRAFT_1891789 [Mycena leptocephala]|nr:hypothetical protein B0H13DRAFT_1891789 [Mycena leptocephala]
MSAGLGARSSSFLTTTVTTTHEIASSARLPQVIGFLRCNVRHCRVLELAFGGVDCGRRGFFGANPGHREALTSNRRGTATKSTGFRWVSDPLRTCASSTARQKFVLDVLISEPAAIPDVLAVDPSFSFCVLSFLKIPINRFQSPHLPVQKRPSNHPNFHNHALGGDARCMRSGQFATAGEVFIVSLHVSSGLTRPDHLRLHLPECLLEWDAIAKNAHSMYSTTSSPASLTNPLSDAFHSHLGDSGAIMPIRVYQRHVTWRARRTSHVLTHLPSPVKSCSAQYYRLHKKLTGPMSTCALTKPQQLYVFACAKPKLRGTSAVALKDNDGDGDGAVRQSKMQ